jgi:lipopolysaccharide transport system ATP-binding protein
VEKFLDTPVKRYSSGMKVRLAFAVAAHLEPEILIIDEVLAVGDAEFQKKCIGKMRSVASIGRTVLFVSHNIAAVESLCTSCMFMRQGMPAFKGGVEEILTTYLNSESTATASSVCLLNHSGRTVNSQVCIERAGLSSCGVPVQSALRSMDPLTITVAYNAPIAMQPVLGVVVKTHLGTPVFGINNRIVPGYQFSDAPASGTISVHFSCLSLLPGTYLVDLYFGNAHSDIDIVHNAVAFDVCPSDVFGTGRLPPSTAGPMLQTASWTVEATTSSRAEVL